MRKVILGLAVSLDGFIEGPNGEYDWCFTDQDYGMSEFFKRVDAVFIGRKSYEMSLGMEGADTGWMPKMPEYVFSNTMQEVKEGATLVKGDIAAYVRQIKSQPGKDIWLFGGASLTASLMNDGLVDELWLSIHPILLGCGKPLFSGIDHRVHLELQETKSYDTGLVSVKYTLKKK
jgi:dihydrofolate reductase